MRKRQSFLPKLNFSMERKLLSIFGILILLLLAQGGIGIRNVTEMHRVDENILRLTGESKALQDNIALLRLTVFQALGTNKPAELQQLQEQITPLMKILTEQTQFAELAAPFAQSLETYREIMRLHYENFQTQQAYKLMYSDSQRQFDEISNVIQQSQRQIQEQSNQLAVRQEQKAVWIAGIVIGLGLGISLLGWFMLKRFVTRPIRQLVTLLTERLTQGDFRQDLTLGQRDEIGGLANAFQQLKGSLSQVILNVKAAADNFTLSSQRINTSSATLSDGANAQVASIEAVLTSMEEMAANIRQNTENASQTEKIAVNVSKHALLGGQAVAKAVTAMRAIAGKIAVIQDIASQTRMLSLNATIEAARAHEHGRGFSVVAAEVRSLAERTQTAATEINQVVQASMPVVDEAGAILQQLVPEIQKTAHLVQEISAANSEQDTSVNHINLAIQQLNEVTQQNSALAEELAAMAQELATQAGQVQHTIAFFKIAEPAPEFAPEVEHARP